MISPFNPVVLETPAASITLDIGHALVVVVERGGIFGEQRDHEIVRILLDVLDESGNAVGIDGPYDEVAQIVVVGDRPPGFVGFEQEREQIGDRGIVKVGVSGGDNGAVLASERAGEMSPFDVAEALLHCARTDRVEPLSVADVTYGLAHLPATRLLPDLALTATKAVQELLLADGPLGMTEIIERAGISESSYNRHIEDLAALAILEPHTVEGRRKWSAHLEPWWTSGSSATEPHGDESSLLEGWTQWLRDVLSDIVETVDPELEDALSWPPDIDAVVEQADGLEPWLVFVSAHFGVADPDELTANERGKDVLVPGTGAEPPDRSGSVETAGHPEEPHVSSHTAVIGVDPAGPASPQVRLPVTAADDEESIQAHTP